MTAPDGSASPDAQRRAVERAMAEVAGLLRRGHRVALTHGNGPQVGNILVKQQLTAHVVPPVPLDWCGAQTQGTIGVMIMNALDRELPGLPVATVVTRTLVDTADPAFAAPTKPIGRYFTEAEARDFQRQGQTWRRFERGWRRVVPSPQPLEILDAAAVVTLVDAGYTVVAAGGGGVPVARRADGALEGVEAVIDKDLAAAELARAVRATTLVIATDVPGVVIGYGTPQARPLGATTAGELRALQAEGHFPSGSMGPKVEAALRFVERGGGRAVITSLEHIGAALSDKAGTSVNIGTRVEK